ncbi:efflux RND transporter permease subunit [Novacetimonas pomaceti]|uniref:efflux RND transporter permease subunit n=1 Tax=Novacetimonas pomaceti TaxID=2021998 RepID=UPI001C2DAECD|nr:efflux RND transporter permease subunit [Novacetimonas pomaceti]MBV1833995.1 efflux RND transporter permease subunit [Novacetimonas pomaceti]
MKHILGTLVDRPVIPIVICLLLLVCGLKGAVSLPIQRFPQTVSARIQISTTYYGADADTVAGFITSPIEAAVAQTNGVDYITSKSQTGVGIVTIYLRLNVDPRIAIAQVQAYVSAIQNRLPQGTQQPVITMSSNEEAAMYVAVSSKVLRLEQVSDYVSRIVVPRLQAVQGVQQALSVVQGDLALRVWLDPDKMIGYGLTAQQIASTLAANDYVTGVGTTLGSDTYTRLTITTGLHTEEQFRNLVLRRNGSAIVRLGDVARVTYGPENTTSSVLDSYGKSAFIRVTLAPAANLLNTERDLLGAIDELKNGVPPGLSVAIAYDAADFVHASLHEVIMALTEAIVIVSLTIVLFLGSLRAVLVPLVTIPLSLVGTIAIMSWLGFSFNLLTLLALVLAIGLVVDDAIIVVENVSRHLANGLNPGDAAKVAVGDLFGPIVAMTVVLAAAYLPIGLQGGLTGALFTEFAFTLAASVTVSALLAVVLSPMMCAYVLPKHDASESRFVAWSDRQLTRIEAAYEKCLARVLARMPVILLTAFCVLASNAAFFHFAKTELAPQEDTGTIGVSGDTSPTATTDSIARSDQQIIDVFKTLPEVQYYSLGDAPGSIDDGVTLTPWSDRSRTADDIIAVMQSKLNAVGALDLVAYQPPSLPGVRGMPIQFVVRGNGTVSTLAAVSARIVSAARGACHFTYLATDLKIDQPETTINLDRDKIAQLGLTVSDVGDSLSWLLGGSYVNYFSLQQRSYRVLPLVTRAARLNDAQVLDYPVTYIGAAPVPLSQVATLTRRVVPEQIPHFQGMLATTLNGVPGKGVTVQDAYRCLQSVSAHLVPNGFFTDTSGRLRAFEQERGRFLPNFLFGLLVIFLCLTAMFNSFRDPLIILISVPMSTAGAVFCLWLGLGGATINLYSEIGLVTLAGLISKHGILIVEVANEARDRGLAKRDAVIHAAGLRLRPILMTTAAMTLGVIPLLAASGAGSAARYVMGLVICAGLVFGTIMTLFVVPAFYLALSYNDRKTVEPSVP